MTKIASAIDKNTFNPFRIIPQKLADVSSITNEVEILKVEEFRHLTSTNTPSVPQIIITLIKSRASDSCKAQDLCAK